MLGLMSAMDTLCPQALGYGDRARYGRVALRAFVISSMAIAPVALLWWHGEALLLKLHQQPEPARLAGLYTGTMVWGLPGYVARLAMDKFLQNQKVVRPALIVAVISLPVHTGLCVLLIRRLGFIGAPIRYVAGAGPLTHKKKRKKERKKKRKKERKKEEKSGRRKTTDKT